MTQSESDLINCSLSLSIAILCHHQITNVFSLHSTLTVQLSLFCFMSQTSRQPFQQQLTLRHTKRLVFSLNRCLADYLEVNKKGSKWNFSDERGAKKLWWFSKVFHSDLKTCRHEVLCGAVRNKFNLKAKWKCAKKYS